MDVTTTAAAFALYSVEQRHRTIRQCRQSRLRLIHAARQLLDTFHTAFPLQRPSLTPDRVRRALGNLAAASLRYADTRRVPPPPPPPEATAAATEPVAPKKAAAPPTPAPKPPLPRPRLTAPEGVGSQGGSGDVALGEYMAALQGLVSDMTDGSHMEIVLEGPDQVGWFLDDMLGSHMDRIVRQWGNVSLYHERLLFILSHPHYNFTNVGDGGDERERAFYEAVRNKPIPLHPEHVRESLAYTDRPLRAARGEAAVVPPPPPGGAGELFEHLLFSHHLPPAMVLLNEDEGKTMAAARGYPVTLAQVASSVGLYRDVGNELPWVVHRPLTKSESSMAWLYGLDRTGTLYELRHRIDVLLAEDMGQIRSRGRPVDSGIVVRPPPSSEEHAVETGDPITDAILVPKPTRSWAQLSPDSTTTAAILRERLAPLFEGRDAGVDRMARYAHVDLVDALYTTGPTLLANKKAAVAAYLTGLGTPASAVASDWELSQQTVTEVVSLFMLVDGITTALRLVSGPSAMASLGVASRYDETLEDSVQLLRAMATDWYMTAQDLLPPPVFAAARQVQEILEAGGYGPIEANLDYGGSLFCPAVVTRDVLELEGVRIAARGDLHRLFFEHYLADWMARTDATSPRQVFAREINAPTTAEMADIVPLFGAHVASSCVHVMGHTMVGASLMMAVPWALGLPVVSPYGIILHVALERGYRSSAVGALLDRAVTWAPPTHAGRSALPGNLGALITMMHTLYVHPQLVEAATAEGGRLAKLVALLKTLMDTYRLTLDDLNVEVNAGVVDASTGVVRELADLKDVHFDDPDAPRSILVDGRVNDDAAKGSERLPTLMVDLVQLVPPDLLHNAMALKHALRRLLFLLLQ